MRWSYLIPRLVLVSLLWAAMAFGLDPLLRYSATQSVQSITSAKADIGQITSGFFPPVMTVDHTAIASPQKAGTNLIEFESLQVSLAGQPLLRKAFVVEEAHMTGVRFGTSRNDNGQLPQIPDAQEPDEPSWIAEKLRSIGDEWLDDLIEQTRGQLDPNLLETYRTGNALHQKWDVRLDEMNVRLDRLKQEADLLRDQMQQAGKARSVDQIQMYLQLAQRGELLWRDAQQLKADITGMTPEVREDFLALDQARRNDQEKALHAVRLLKPDARRISESLIGEEMYRQLQQLLTWLETAREYQQGLKKQTRPERQRGHDFEFPILNPTPQFLCRRLLLSGELMLDNHPTAFKATLTDVTSNPQLHQQPAVLKLQTSGEHPLRMIVRHDATTDTTATDLVLDYSGTTDQPITAGNAQKAQLLSSLKNQHWNVRMKLVEDQIQGELLLTCELGPTSLQSEYSGASLFTSAFDQMASQIQQVTATVSLDGQLTRPQVSVKSDLGEQLSAGFQQALSLQATELKTRFSGQIDELVSQQRQRLSASLGSRYQQLLSENAETIQKIQQVRQLVASVQSGQVDPNAVFRQVSESGALSQKDQKKVDQAGKVLNGLNNPGQAIQQALPGWRDKLLR